MGNLPPFQPPPPSEPGPRPRPGPGGPDPFPFPFPDKYGQFEQGTRDQRNITD